MTLIKDYLGNIATGINQARVMADLESAKIAKMYAKDELLRNFSVPRFRAQNIELTIPIALKSVEVATKSDKNPPTFDQKELKAKTYQVLKTTFKVESFDRLSATAISRRITQFSTKLKKETKLDKNTDDYVKSNVNELSKSIIEILHNNKEFLRKTKLNRKQVEETFSKVNSKLYEVLKDLVIIDHSVIDTNDNLDVIVEAHKLKELPHNSLIQIKMTLTEEGMEWQTLQNEDGSKVSKLLPE